MQRFTFLWSLATFVAALPLLASKLVGRDGTDRILDLTGPVHQGPRVHGIVPLPVDASLAVAPESLLCLNGKQI